MLSIIIQIILLFTIIINLILSICMLYSTYRQYKNDKAFYERLKESLEKQPAVFLDKDKAEGGVERELSKNTKGEK